MSDKSTGDSPATSSGQSSSVVVAKRKPIPRKGHTKSRAGCVVCKRRRVKCDEASPECGQCRRLGLECEYLNKKKPASPPESTSLARPLRTAPATFDIDDMRFFRHFLFEAYPPLPIDGGPVWHQVSQLIYEYDFLLHAFLAIGASHLNLLSSADYEKAALKHRVLAIKSLNEHLSKSEMSIPDAEAAFGATLALTFQSAYMPDGLPDFLTMVRGCFLIGTYSIPDFNTCMFRTFARDAYVYRVRELIERETSAKFLDSTIAEEYCANTKRFAHLCKSVAQVEYLAHMQNIAGLAATDPAESYRELSYFYDRMGSLRPEDFASFIDPDNHVSQLVIMHMLILDFVMSRKSIEAISYIGSSIGFKKGFDYRRGMSKLWIEQIYERLPIEYKPYAEWTVNFSRSLMVSHEHENEVWNPFLLTNGKAIMPVYHNSVPV